jgi:hypothetical protein
VVTTSRSCSRSISAIALIVVSLVVIVVTLSFTVAMTISLRHRRGGYHRTPKEARKKKAFIILEFNEVFS